MQITPITIEFSKVKGYKASYNHKGVQIVEFAPTRIEAIKAVFSTMEKYAMKPCGHFRCSFDLCSDDIPL